MECIITQGGHLKWVSAPMMMTIIIHCVHCMPFPIMQTVSPVLPQWLNNPWLHFVYQAGASFWLAGSFGLDSLCQMITCLEFSSAAYNLDDLLICLCGEQRTPSRSHQVPNTWMCHCMWINQRISFQRMKCSVLKRFSKNSISRSLRIWALGMRAIILHSPYQIEVSHYIFLWRTKIKQYRSKCLV